MRQREADHEVRRQAQREEQQRRRSSETLEAWLSVRFVEAPGVLFSAWMKIAVKPAITSSADGHEAQQLPVARAEHRSSVPIARGACAPGRSLGLS